MMAGRESARFNNKNEPNFEEQMARPLWLLYTWRAVQVIDRGVDLVGSMFTLLGVVAAFRTWCIARQSGERITLRQGREDVHINLNPTGSRSSPSFYCPQIGFYCCLTALRPFFFFSMFFLPFL